MVEEQKIEKKLALEHTSIHPKNRISNNETVYSKIFDILNVLFLLLFIATVLYPFLFTIAVSLSKTFPIKAGLVHVWPIGFNIDAYKVVFQTSDIFRAYWNSIFYTVFGTFLVLLFGALAAYPLAQRNFKPKKILTILFTIPMFFSGGLIPLFLLVRELNMLNTVWAIVLPSAFGFWLVVLLRTNFQSLPDGLMESAHIDGANDWHILIRIILPLSVPILVTMALFTSVGIWNSYSSALIFLNDADKMPITIVLRDMISSSRFQFDTNFVVDPERDTASIESKRMAVFLLTTGPIILVYPFIQKYFVKGQLVGSLKG